MLKEAMFQDCFTGYRKSHSSVCATPQTSVAIWRDDINIIRDGSLSPVNLQPEVTIWLHGGASSAQGSDRPK